MIVKLSGATYYFENPISAFSNIFGKPDFIFHPSDYTGYCRDDNYTKKTCLWTGNGFIMPDPFVDSSLGPPDDRIHKMGPSDERENMRSKTPLGFSRAVYEVNN